MKRLQLLLCGMALVLSACGTDHHDRKPPEAPWHPATAMLEKYVTNADGSLTRAQMETGLRADFNAADKNHTGCLDTDETRAINEERLAEDKSTASPLVDFSGKGCIDFDTFASTPRSLFDTMDRDNNGVLTAQELHPWQPPKKDGEQGGQNAHRGRHAPGDAGPGGDPDGN
jgi:Ca2+-binding EF-hand superfamily protein